MNKPTFDAMVAQYAVKDASGEGAASWDGGVRCVIPEVLVYGKAVQDGTPTPDVPVMPEFSAGTEVVSRGKNLADIYGFSAGSIERPGAAMTTSNKFGTIISTTEVVNAIAVQQSMSPRPDDPGHSGNGFFMVGVDNYFENGEIVTISFDLEVIENPLGVDTISVGSNGVSFGVKSAIGGRVRSKVVWLNYKERKYIEIRLWGISGVFSNFQIEYGTTATPYAPYFDGGSATAPELLAIPGTEYRDEWDAQTGKGVRRCAVIASYAGEHIGTPYISSTGKLSEGAYVVYGIPDTPFQTDPQPLIAPKGTGHIMQVGGNLDGCPITAKYVTHS